MRVFRVVLLCLGAVVSLIVRDAVAAAATTTQTATTQTTVTQTATAPVPVTETSGKRGKTAAPPLRTEAPSLFCVRLGSGLFFVAALVAYWMAAKAADTQRSAIYLERAAHLALRASVAIFLVYALAVASAYVIAVAR